MSGETSPRFEETAYSRSSSCSGTRRSRLRSGILDRTRNWRWRSMMVWALESSFLKPKTDRNRGRDEKNFSNDTTLCIGNACWPRPGDSFRTGGPFAAWRQLEHVVRTGPGLFCRAPDYVHDGG